MTAMFLISSLVSVIGSIILITQRNAVYALLGLLIAFFGSAGVFRALDAPFIAVAQILIYAGALAVMFLFVLMFTDTRTQLDALGIPGAVGARVEYKPGEDRRAGEKAMRFNPLDHFVLPKPLAAVVSLAFLVCATWAIVKLPASFGSFGDLPAPYVVGQTTEGADRTAAYGSVHAVSVTIFEKFPLAFEVVSLLIFAAVMGAVLLARRHLASPAVEAAYGTDSGQDVTDSH